MKHSNLGRNEASKATLMTPDMLKKLKKEDMKQAIMERFCYRAKATRAEGGVPVNPRSPAWQPVDDEC